MDLGQLIVPSGITAFALFLISLMSGFYRRRMRVVHSVSAYLCLAVVLFHSAAAMLCGIFEPVGLLASAGMILSVFSGIFGWGMTAHITLGIITLVLSVAHVVFIQVMK